jgi:Domain of unknown function (DUF6531)
MARARRSPTGKAVQAARPASTPTAALAAGAKDTSCGNPVIASTGNKIETEMDFTGGGEAALFLQREYNKYWNGVGLFGKHWISSFDYRLTFGTSIPTPAFSTA